MYGFILYTKSLYLYFETLHSHSLYLFLYLSTTNTVPSRLVYSRWPLVPYGMQAVTLMYKQCKQPVPAFSRIHCLLAQWHIVTGKKLCGRNLRKKRTVYLSFQIPLINHLCNIFTISGLWTSLLIVTVTIISNTAQCLSQYSTCSLQRMNWITMMFASDYRGSSFTRNRDSGPS